MELEELIVEIVIGLFLLFTSYLSPCHCSNS